MRCLILGLALFVFPSLAGAENIDVFPLSWDFDDVEIGNAASQKITITGAGTYFDSEIGLIEILEDPPEAFTLLDPPAPETFVPPGEMVAFQIVFTPPHVGHFSAVLRVPSSDLRHPDLDIPLSGVGIVPEPATLAILLTGCGLGAACWRRSTKRLGNH